MDFQPWLILLLCLVPALGLMAVIFAWRWRLDRSGERLPFGEKLLRPAGESLRRRIEELDERLDGMIVLTMISPFIVAVTLLSGPKLSKAAYGVVVATWAGAFAWQGVRLIRLARDKRNHRLGFHGERAVAEELNQLMLQGCRVFHDVPMEPYGNIDHVIVAPSGVYAVETKTRRKRKAPAGTRQREYEVIYDGKALHFPHTSDSHGLAQARQQADRLRAFLTKAVGEPVGVLPILTLPGWLVTSRVNGELKALNPKMIAGAIRRNGSPILPPQLLQRVAHQLDQKCRDVEL